MKYGVIYKITNPNGRIYIGQSNSFTRRIKHYKEMEHSGRNNQPIISNSIKKYGFEAHIIQRILLGTRTSNDLSYTFKYK